MTFVADTPMAVPMSDGPSPFQPVRFEDRGGLFGLLVKNAVLTFVTLGIYRFWARAALRRYWWGSINLAGDPFEYTGTGLELFIGFLMFLAIMLPLALVYGLTALLEQGNPLAAALLRLPELLVIFVLIQFVTFRARRYRLSRTVWRGVRASQGGTSGQYLGLVVKWTLLGIVTLGLATPWARMATTRYLTDRTALGDLEARFSGRGRDLFLPFVVPYVVFFGSFIGFTAMNVVHSPGIVSMPTGLWILGLGYIGVLLGLLAYSLIELRYTIRKTRFGDIELGSTFSVSAIALRIIGFGFVASLALTATVLAAGALAYALGFASPTAPPSVQGIRIVFAVLAFLIGFGLINILRIFWIDKAIVREICETMSMTHIDQLNRIGRSTAPIPKAGEGMADAFDIGAAF